MGISKLLHNGKWSHGRGGAPAGAHWRNKLSQDHHVTATDMSAIDDPSQTTQSLLSSSHFGCLSLQLPANAAVSLTPLSAPGTGWRGPSLGTRQRETGETKFSDLILVMWIIVILSWSNLYPTQVPWEEEATAAQEPPLAIQPSALWTQLRICLRHT